MVSAKVVDNNFVCYLFFFYLWSMSSTKIVFLNLGLSIMCKMEDTIFPI